MEMWEENTRTELNYADKEWYERDVSEEVNSMAVEIVSYFDEFEEEDSVCMVWLNDINIESQVENAALICNAPDMYRLLLQAESFLPAELINEWQKIQKSLSRKPISE